MSSNLPPGVTEGMIPGNTSEDAAWKTLFDDIGADADVNIMNAADAKIAWAIGLQAFLKVEEYVSSQWKDNISRQMLEMIEECKSRPR
jgi:hypothetical protein